MDEGDSPSIMAPGERRMERIPDAIRVELLDRYATLKGADEQSCYDYEHDRCQEFERLVQSGVELNI